MGRQYYSELLAWATSSGTPVANTTTETIVQPNLTVPANYMSDGRLLRVTAAGSYSNTGTPTTVFSARWGGVAGTLLTKSGAPIQQNGIVNGVWWLQFIMQLRTNGATGTIMANGLAHFFASGAPTVGTGTQAAGTTPMTLGGQTGPGVATCDLTADAALSLTATWSAASASNTLTCTNYMLESLN